MMSTRMVVVGASPSRVLGTPSMHGSPSPGHGVAGVPDLGYTPRFGYCLAVPFRVLWD
jgi:hypothetical protein